MTASPVSASSQAAAFRFLIVRSTANKLRSQLRRLKNPRNALALLFGLGYFWLVFFNRGARHGPGMPSSFMDAVSALLPLLLLVLAVYVWLFVNDKAALAFTPAEVSLLFTAPVSRRTLILYKLARSQTAVLSTSIIWVMIINHGTRAVERGISYWLMLSTISMHRLGVALVRTAQTEHGRAGVKKVWPVMLVAAAAVGAVAWSIYQSRTAMLGASDPGDVRDALVAAISTPPASWALYPFKALIAPTFAHSTELWLAAIPAAVALLVIHVVWVVATDAAFEEAAVEASAVRARRLTLMRSRGTIRDTVSAKARKRGIRLSPTGEPAVAILWKNTLWIMRSGQMRAMLGIPAVLAGVAVLAHGRSQFAETMVFAVSCTLASTTMLFGPMTMRNDLRSDLARLPILKTLPLAGRKIVLAEILSSALPVALTQYLYVLCGVIAISFFDHRVPTAAVRVGIVLGAPLALVGLNIANFAIHNGIAITFPAWIRVGDGLTSGIEMMGQRMLTLVVTLVMLALLLVGPALGGGAAWFVMRGIPAVSFVLAAVVGGVLLALECYPVMNMLGAQLDKLEPQHVS